MRRLCRHLAPAAAERLRRHAQAHAPQHQPETNSARLVAAARASDPRRCASPAMSSSASRARQTAEFTPSPKRFIREMELRRLARVFRYSSPPGHTCQPHARPSQQCAVKKRRSARLLAISAAAGDGTSPRGFCGGAQSTCYGSKSPGRRPSRLHVISGYTDNYMRVRVPCIGAT